MTYNNLKRLESLQDLDSGRTSSRGGARGLIHCGNHRNRIGENDTKAAIDDDAMTKLVSFISMVRASGWFILLLAATYATVSASYDCIIGHPPPGANSLGEYLRDHMVYYKFRFQDATRTDRVVLGEKATEGLRAQWDKLLSMVVIKNGRYTWYTDAEPTLPQRDTFVGKLSQVLAKTILKTAPGKPEQGKWTKDSPGTRFHLHWLVELSIRLPDYHIS